ncbi:NAD(P)/FAD-dependent oxidoreductase [Geodermatophilaceae bacterium NBWT11]|nr:NAD(P)/FAD-dependent oxidoreductase [Geodermatophilaceae bacterium NBWT11]
MTSSTAGRTDLDAIVIGAGFAGMYALHRLRDDLGLEVQVVERGTGVGGTWYWNRYPGARCDVESMSYSYSFDEQLEQEWEWTELYPAQPELLAYAEHVATRFDLRRDIAFGTVVESATFVEATHRWTVATDDGREYTATYLVTAVGCLSASMIPDIPGLDEFTGRVLHTGRWPHEGVDFTGRRVAVVGTGSSGIQVIPQLAGQAEHLTVFQRTPSWSLPARNRPLGPEEVADTKASYRRLRADNAVAPSGTRLRPPVGSTTDFTPSEQTAELARRWEDGGAAFLATFTDTARDERANEVPAGFVRDRIHEMVTDPATAELLTPRTHPIGAKRICLDTDYFTTYNRPGVSLVSVRDTPIEAVTGTGLLVGGVEHEVDDIVFATGYDAMTGPLNAISVRGRAGRSLRDEWAAGPRTYLGVATAGFPNLFMLTGPGSPSVLVNMVVSIEQHVDWVTELVRYTRASGVVSIEAQASEQDAWVEHVGELAATTLFRKAASWYLGANVPGKPRVFMPYVGGMGRYRATCDQVAAAGYPGFVLQRADGSVVPVAPPVPVPAVV